MNATKTPTPEQIKAARIDASLTQGSAAALVYRTTRNWQQWESGERQMDRALWELFQLKASACGRR